jgi:hypothetical protein
MEEKVLRVCQAASHRLVDQGAEAVAVFGSRARGDAYEESDIDMQAIGKGPGCTLRRSQGFLISISWMTASQHRRSFMNPGTACGIVPAWRNAVIISDPKGVARSLKEEAAAWEWERIGWRADRWVAEEITGWAEEVHRLVGNLRMGRRSAAAAQRSALAIKMAPIMAVRHQILYDSENRLWDLVAKRMGKRWTDAQAAALGERGEGFEKTCIGALRLYVLAAREAKHLLDSRQREVVSHACDIAVLANRGALADKSKK